MEKFEEVETRNDVVVVVSKSGNLPVEKPVKSSFRGDTISTLKDVLMDNIKKVQQSPDYIPQATTIANTVNSLVNLAKIEMQLNENS